MKIVQKLMLVALLAVGIPLLLFALYSTFSTTLFLLNSNKMEGVIESIDASSANTVASVRLKDRNELLSISTVPGYKIGDHVRVRVRSGNPTDGRFTDFTNLWGSAVSCLFVFVLLCLPFSILGPSGGIDGVVGEGDNDGNHHHHSDTPEITSGD